ncbi:MAG: serine hydrolase domain-containing protein [Bacteroidota bacterium]
MAQHFLSEHMLSAGFTASSRLSCSRRQFGKVLSAGLLGAMMGCQATEEKTGVPIDVQLAELFAGDPMPGGLAAAAVRGEKLVWSGGFGHADIGGGIPMSPDHIQNIGSISKTVTATAIMQLWEQGAFKLDDDINAYLPYSVRNPRFPDAPITFRQLLAHRSSINDGPSYDESYACGDPAVSLAEWIEGYFTEGGAYYDAEANFHTWIPGTTNPPESPRAYSNVAYGLLGVLVEQIAGGLFSDYCRQHIFEPLRMDKTGWHLSEIDQSQHAMLYSGVPEEAGETLYLPADGTRESLVVDGVYPHCLYSFYNYPDGLVRTSVNGLSRFLRAYMNGGALEGGRILKAETIQTMLSDQHFERGLCWDTYGDEDDVWGHDGGDPGVATFMGYTPAENLGVVLFFNAGNFSDNTNEMVSALFEAARTAA